MKGSKGVTSFLVSCNISPGFQLSLKRKKKYEKITKPSSGVCENSLKPFLCTQTCICVCMYYIHLLYIKSVIFCKDFYDISSVQAPVLTPGTGNEKVNT